MAHQARPNGQDGWSRAATVGSGPSRRPPERPGIRIATLNDLAYLDGLQRRDKESVGFLPLHAIASHITAGRVHVATLNADPVAYVIAHPAARWQPALTSIYQACVQYDARRRHVGLALLDHVRQWVASGATVGVQANCAIGVEANEFWQGTGFTPICHFSTGNTRGRELVCWRLPLTRKLPLWFANPPALVGFPPRPPTLKRDTSRSERSREEASRYVPGFRSHPRPPRAGRSAPAAEAP